MWFGVDVKKGWTCASVLTCSQSLLLTASRTVAMHWNVAFCPAFTSTSPKRRKWGDLSALEGKDSSAWDYSSQYQNTAPAEHSHINTGRIHEDGDQMMLLVKWMVYVWGDVARWLKVWGCWIITIVPRLSHSGQGKSSAMVVCVHHSGGYPLIFSRLISDNSPIMSCGPWTNPSESTSTCGCVLSVWQDWGHSRTASRVHVCDWSDLLLWWHHKPPYDGKQNLSCYL